MAKLELLQTIDRNQAVRDASAKLAPALRAYAETRHSHMAHLIKLGGEEMLCLEMTQEARTVLELWRAANADPKLREEVYKHSPGSGGFKGFEEDRFFGMTPASYEQEIRGVGHNLRDRMARAQEELAKTGLKEELQQMALGQKKRRRRMFSDCEGEFHYDRRQEDQPFSRMITHKRDFPFIELIFPMGFNSGAKAEEISNFHARSLALAEVLESVGYRVAITGEIWAVRLIGSGEFVKGIFPGKTFPSHRVAECARFPLREAGAYGDLAGYAVTACAEFFRRALFHVYFDQAHEAHGLTAGFGHRADSMKGSALDERPLPLGPGQLCLTKSVLDGLFSMNQGVRDTFFREHIAHSIGLGDAKRTA